jgi:glycosyltransferase involved in cell wall biosynthesis
MPFPDSACPSCPFAGTPTLCHARRTRHAPLCGPEYRDFVLRRTAETAGLPPPAPRPRAVVASRGPGNTPTPRPRPSGHLHVRGYLDSWTGYGQIAERVGFGLRDAAGVELSWGAIKLDQTYFPTHPDILANLRDAPPPGANVLQIATPLTQPIEGFPCAVLSMWEADRINAQAAAQLNRAAVVVVPCRHNEKAFRDSGVTVPIRVVPMGIDTEVYYDRDDFDMDGPFVFGAAGRQSHGGKRKALMDVAACFIKLAEKMPDACLNLKIFPDCDMGPVPTHPRIKLTRTPMLPWEMANWYRSLTCYTTLSRGEGWGMQTHQSMSVGRPVIAIPYSGTADFWTPGSGWPVAFSIQPAREFYEGCGANWAEYDEESACEAMLAAYNDRDECRRRGKVAAARAAEFPWRRTAEGVREALTEFGFLAGPEPDLPPLATRAANYAKAQIRHTLDGRARADNATLSDRLTICEDCDRFRASDRKCSECGCPIEEKAAWRSESCPLGKWPAVGSGGCGRCPR